VRYLLDLGADGMYAKLAKRFVSAHTQQQQHVLPNPGGDSTASLASVDKPSSATSNPQLTADSSNSSIAGNLKLSDAALAPASAKKLLGNGANTPLHWACYKGHAEVVTVLLHAGYAIEDVDPIGNRALHLAGSGGFCDVVEILLAHSAVVDQRNRYGNRPLDLTIDVACRKLLEKFQRTTQCEWCKESFNRLRRASLCQHCHNVYCDVKPCSSVTEMVIGTLAVDQTPNRPSSAATGTAAVGAGRSMRYCQECATEMGQTEQELRSILDAKLELIRTTVEMITRASTPPMDSPPACALPSSRPSTQASGSGSGRPVTAAASGSGPPSSESSGHGSSSIDTVSGDPVGFSDTDNVESLLASPADLEPPRPLRRLLTNDEITKTLTLSQTDAEALYTSIEAAQLKAVDRELVARAKQTYRQLVAHVALQEEIQSLMAVRPIGVRSLVAPLKTALLNARRASVSPEMLLLGVQVVRSAEAECTLFGCEALCAKIELATQKHRRDIARLEASVRESQAVGVHDKLLASAVALRDRLHAEVQLQACLQPFTPVAATSETAVATAYRFEDGTEATTLLQALELRNQKIQSAVVRTHSERASILVLILAWCDITTSRTLVGRLKGSRRRCWR
jgi:hypothetical protein